MEFTKSLVKGKLIKRYKRFFTDVKLGKEIVTAHCPNTGSMKGLLDEGNEVYLLPNNDPKRKLKYGLEIIKSRKNLVGVNTHMANRIVEHGLNNNLIKELKNNGSIKPEVFFNKETRFDFLLKKKKQKIVVMIVLIRIILSIISFNTMFNTSACPGGPIPGGPHRAGLILSKKEKEK